MLKQDETLGVGKVEPADENVPALTV